MPHHDLILANAWIHSMDPTVGTIRNGYVAIDGDTITAIKAGPVPVDVTARRLIDVKGEPILPGFVNSHLHIFQSLLKGLGADRRLVDWLNDSAFAFGPTLGTEQHKLAAELACREAISSGCTTVAEFFYTNQDPELAHACIAGMRATGIRSIFIRTFQDTGEEYGMPTAFIESAEVAFERVQDLRDHYGTSDMLTIWTGPDVTWSTTEQGYRALVEYTEANQVRYSMHLKETEVDDEMCQRMYGVGIIKMLEDVGALTDKLLAVHCVNLTDGDIRAFGSHGVNVSHNPASNMYLASGVAPIPKLRRHKVPVSIGTDGAASNNTTNMLESLKLAALIQKGWHRDAAIVTARDVVEMATIGGAQAIGMDDRIGSLAIGKLADVIVFDTRKITSTPTFDPLATIVYASTPANVRTSIVNGNVIYEDGKFPDDPESEKLISAVRRSVAPIVAAL